MFKMMYSHKMKMFYSTWSRIIPQGGRHLEITVIFSLAKDSEIYTVKICKLVNCKVNCYGGCQYILWWKADFGSSIIAILTPYNLMKYMVKYNTYMYQ